MTEGTYEIESFLAVVVLLLGHCCGMFRLLGPIAVGQFRIGVSCGSSAKDRHHRPSRPGYIGGAQDHFRCRRLDRSVPSRKVTENVKVSLWSKGSTARQLLDKLCLVNGYVYKEDEGNVIYLMTKDEYEQVFGGVTRTFCLNFQKAESVKPLIEAGLDQIGQGVDRSVEQYTRRHRYGGESQEGRVPRDPARPASDPEAISVDSRPRHGSGPNDRPDVSTGGSDSAGYPQQFHPGLRLRRLYCEDGRVVARARSGQCH